MAELKEFAAALIMVVLALWMTSGWWWDLVPSRFTVRYVLIATTVIAALLGVCVAFAPR